MKYPAPLDGSNHPVYSNPQMAMDISSAIRRYTPQKMARHLWSEEMAEFTRTAVTDFGPLNGLEAGTYMRSLAGLLIHTVRVKCEPLERKVVFDGRNIDGYYADVLKRKASGAETRLRLLRLASELHVFDPDRRDAGAKRTAKTFAPYMSIEIVRLLSQGRSRSTPKRRHNWQSLVALGAGFGLTAVEAVNLKASDIVDRISHLEARVAGTRPRVVICLSDWEDRLRTLLTSELITDYVIVTLNRPNALNSWTAQYIADMSSWDTGFSMARLRATFVVKHLEAGTSPIHLIRMLGVKQFSTIERLLPFATVASVEESAALLRVPKEGL